MLLIRIVLLCSIIYVQGDDFLDKFNQHQYKLKDVKMDVVNCSKKLMNRCEAKTFKYNRTTPAVNVTLNSKIDLEDKLEILVQVYKMASNEYRIFPIRFQMTAAKAFNANVAGLQRIKKCGNILKVYFIKNKTYYFCNFVIDESKLPPLIPTGQYLLEVYVLYLEQELVKGIVQAEVFIPVKYPSS